MTTERNQNIIENIKNTYWDGKSEVTFNVNVDKIFRTEKGLKDQIKKIPISEGEHNVNGGTIFAAIPEDNADGVAIVPVAVEREA